MNAATQNEMERLFRVNREQAELLDRIYQYVDELDDTERGSGGLGSSGR